MDTKTLVDVVAKTVHESLRKILEPYKLILAAPPAPPALPVFAPPAHPSSSAAYRNFIAELVAMKNTGEVSSEIISRGCRAAGVANLIELADQPNLTGQVRDWIRKNVITESIKQQFPDMFETPAEISPTQKTHVKKCPSGSWIALSRNAETIIRHIEVKNPGKESRRLKTFKKLRDLLASGPASRMQVTKLLVESDPIATYNNISGIVTQAMVRGVIVVVTAPR